jgi:hypothetical protein
MGFAQTHTASLPQSESALQPWTHSHEEPSPASGLVSSQWPYGSEEQSESDVQPTGEASNICEHAPLPVRGKSEGHVTCARRRMVPSAHES